jgi:hypothetical protein
MSDIAIKVENLSKLYKIGAKQERYKTLRDTLTNPLKTLLASAKGYVLYTSPSNGYNELNSVLYPVRKPRHLPRWIVNILRGLWWG